MARRAKNLSVVQFQQLMENIPKAVATELRSAVFDAANDLSALQRANATSDDGDFKASHRVEEGKHPLQALVVAGGLLTTRPVGGGTYDYAMAVEYGTEKMVARPSFWPTYRANKRKIKSKIARRAKKAIGQLVNLR